MTQRIPAILAALGAALVALIVAVAMAVLTVPAAAAPQATTPTRPVIEKVWVSPSLVTTNPSKMNVR